MKKSILFFCFMCAVLVASAQVNINELLRSKDLSTFKVDNLSDEDIAKYRDYIQNAGITEAQAEQMALQRGLPSSEVLKLKARLAKIGAAKSQANNGTSRRTMDTSYLSSDPQNLLNQNQNQQKSNIFGAELFANNNLTFEPNLRIATPKNYTIGPDDEIAIDVYGYQEINPRLTVSAEGSINIPNVGMVPVNGLTVEQATKRIREKMIRNGYASIGSGQSQMAVSISRIRSIRVTVIGEAKRPGTYTISSLANLFNALYAAGGPADKGSFRTIELVRNNKVVEKLDAYDFLLRGDQTHNVRLYDQDIIRIPVAKVQVSLKGEVKRPGVYEVLPKESLADVIEFAGGFTDRAYTASIHIQQYTDKAKKVRDVRAEELATFIPGKGDEVKVGKVLERFLNRVVIHGAIYRPGEYELRDGLTLAQLIRNADGVKEHAFKERGLLFRTNEDLTNQVIPFNITNLLNGTDADIKLQKDDSISITSLREFKEKYTITIDGEVRKPDVYPYFTGITLKDVLLLAGGFTDGASVQHIEVARRLGGDSVVNKEIAQVLEIATESELGNNTNNIVLQPWDVVIVRSKPGYKSQITVKVEGEVLYPGTYVLSTKEDRVSDIIKRAGGLTPQADRTGGNVTRLNTSQFKNEAAERVQKLKQVSTTDTATSQIIEDITKPTVKIGLNLDQILKTPDELNDVVLQEGDVVTIPKERKVVRINGEVMFPTEVVYKEGASMDYYIDKAGGFTENARMSKLYVLNSNGSAAKTKKFLFFKSYPRVTPGSEILVPKIPERSGKGLSTAEWLAIASGLASLAGVAVAIINVSK